MSEKERGKPVRPLEIVPTCKENIKLSKSEFIERQRERIERGLKVKEYDRELRGAGKVVPEPEVEPKKPESVKPGKPGRKPKSIE